MSSDSEALALAADVADHAATVVRFGHSYAYERAIDELRASK